MPICNKTPEKILKIFYQFGIFVTKAMF